MAAYYGRAKAAVKIRMVCPPAGINLPVGELVLRYDAAVDDLDVRLFERVAGHPTRSPTHRHGQG